MNAGTLSLILAIVVGAAAIVGLYLATKGRSAKESLDLFPAINEELRNQIEFYQAESKRKEQEHADQLERRDRHHAETMRAQAEEFGEKLHKQDVECKRELAELRGKVEVLSSDFVQQIVAGVREAVRHEQ